MKLSKIFFLVTAVFVAASFIQAAEKSKNCGCSCCEGLEVCCCNTDTAVKPKTDDAAIRASLTNRFDQPDAPLSMAPIVVEANYAIASWTQAGVGGRALLRKDGQDWVALLCAGKVLKDTKTLKDAGASETTATLLVKKLTNAEAALPSAQRAKYDAFQGIITLNDSSK